MNLVELHIPEVLDRLPSVDGVDPNDVGEQSGFLRVGEWLALPVTRVACHIDTQTDPEILDETGMSLGTLCLTTKLADVEPTALTKWQYVSYLADVDAAGAGRSHVFQKDYVVLNVSHLNEYLEKYYKSAPVWGGFSHSSIANSVSRECTTLVAKAGIVFPTRFHEMAFSRYVAASNSFERFLRLYHSLELIFDFIIMKSIQKMSDDMVGFGAISRAHGRTEIDRLKYILVGYCDDWESIAAKFAPVAGFEAVAKEIFQDHAKEGNPIQPQKWQKMVDSCRAGQTTQADFTAAKLCDANHPYALLVSNIAAYWIYRVRSSIAHSRISEFLFEGSDEDFIVDFAEGVLAEVVTQVFSNSKLLTLIT